MLASDMVGLCVPAPLAQLSGWPGPSEVDAAGTTAADATELGVNSRFVDMTATGSDGIKLPSDAPLMTPYLVFNSSGSTGKVYPPTSGQLNGGTATSGALSLATLKVAIFYRYSINGWVYILTA